jgi:hypothetical protein
MFLCLASVSAGFARDVGAAPPDNVKFVSAIELIKNRIAENINSVDSFFSREPDNKENVFGPATQFDDLEKDCYRRAITGMELVSYYYESRDSSRAVFYNPVYDVGIVTEWTAPQADKPLLRELFVVSGESLRNEPVRILGPGWLEKGSLDDIVEAYNAVTKHSREEGIISIEEKVAKGSEWTLLNGQTMDDRTVVYKRVMFVGTSLLSAANNKIDQLPAQTVAILRAVKPAVDAASDLQNCLKVGGSLDHVLQCELAKRPFKMVSLPKAASNTEGLGVFLGTTYVEGALPIGNISMAFLASYSPANNYRFILTTVNGEPSGLSLVDFKAH